MGQKQRSSSPSGPSLSMVQQAGNALGVALIGLVYYTHGFAGSLVYLAASALGVALLWPQVARASRAPA